ncbi:MAG TPA: SIMPL domain-containing protein [Dehalococcoidia bacterium]|nr:SIMPL domain-containing protein [Dehalococcoidia bacterium]
MKLRRYLIPIALLGLAGLFAAACGDNGQAAGDDAPGPAPALALQNGAASGSEGITVSGQGTVTLVPDTGSLSLGVSILANTAREARDQAATAMGKLLDSVKGNGIDAKDINTTQFSLNPEYDYSAGRSRITGYRVTNTVAVKVRELDRVPEVIDDAVDAVGDPLQISGVSFVVEDPSAALTQARSLAMGDAAAKAKQLAELGGVSLGKPITISESSSAPPPPVFFDRAAGAAEAPATPIEPGQLQVQVSVQVTYAIQ